MPTFPLRFDGSVSTLAAELSITGFDLIPAGVAAMVLTALGTALVVTALKRRESEREGVVPDEETALPRIVQRVDA